MRAGVRWLLLVFWIGGLWFTGAVLAPLMFRALSPEHAGVATGSAFRAAGWVAVVAAPLYLWLCAPERRRGLRLWLVLGGTALLAAAVFGAGGAMEQLRAVHGAGSVPAWLHRLASVGYVAAMAAGAALVWLDAREVRPTAG